MDDINDARTQEVKAVLMRGLEQDLNEREIERLSPDEIRRACQKHDPARGQAAFDRAVEIVIGDLEVRYRGKGKV
ncbi:MAG: hypothetical protein ABIY55_22365 [Kofleriaceae bacterium]